MHKIFQQICSDRGYDKEFFSDKELPLYFDIHGAAQAVLEIQMAIAQNKKICIYGDYDCDGVMSTTILYKTLDAIGADVCYAIPHREKHGYGVNTDLLDEKIGEGVELFITVDCGITSLEGVEHVLAKGKDIIVTDHHLPGESLPNCTVIHPGIEDKIGTSTMCGAMVAYYLAEGLIMSYPSLKKTDKLMSQLFGLASVATVGDCVELRGFNRTIVKRGLKELQKNPTPAMSELFRRSKFGRLSSEDVAFNVAPIMNSVGRIGDANKAVDAMISSGADELRDKIGFLVSNNVTRKEMQKNINRDCLPLIYDFIEKYQDPNCIVIQSDGFHKGLVGIVASRIMDKFQRPTVIISRNGEVMTGSGRAPEGFNLHKAFKHCQKLLLRSGGHAAAAGLSLESKQFDKFCGKFVHYCNKHFNGFVKPATYEIEISDLTESFFESWEMLRPYGQGNKSPLFTSKLTVKEKRRVSHAASCAMVNGIKTWFFGMDEVFGRIQEGKEYPMSFEIKDNYWNGKYTYQINVREVHFE